MKQSQTETLGLKNTMKKMRNATESINNRLNQAEEGTCELKHNLFEMEKLKIKPDQAVAQ